MTEWELVNLSDSKPETIVEDLSNTDAGGLESEVENLHTNFWQEANHLKEVAVSYTHLTLPTILLV